MKSSNTLVAGLVGVIVAFAPSVFAVDVSPKTLERCASLLPAGKTYSFQMNGTIDMTQGKPILHGQFLMDDGTQVDRLNLNEAFGKCLSALIQ